MILSTKYKLLQWSGVIGQYIAIAIGAIIMAATYLIFMAPYDITVTGVTGVSVILNQYVGTPIGLMIIILNIPIMYLAHRMLPGGFEQLVKMLYGILVYSVSLDTLDTFISSDGVSDDLLLNALFGGILTGLATGLIYRVGTSMGGSSTLALILQRKYGLPLSSTVLYVDMIVIFGAGITFGWEPALYALVVLFLSGIASDYTIEGPSVIRTVVIVTDKPQAVADVIMSNLYRGVSGWEVQGMYTGNKRTMLYVSVSRSQMNQIRQLISDIDPDAFVVIGHGHIAYGYGFRKMKKAKTTKITEPLKIDSASQGTP